jgi:hypothetical protein
MKKLLRALKEWLQVKSHLTLVIAVLLAVIVMLSVTLFFVFRAPGDQFVSNGQDDDIQEHDTAIRHPLTGAVLETPLIPLPQVFAVMIENSADAWPLAGLDEAFLVIEAPVEGGIPRFVAFYSSQDSAAKIGPVRSARPYYLDWADELQAVYAHVGGSPEALDLIKQVGTIDLNEFWNGKYFWRDTKRFAPHNAYTSVDLLSAALSKLSLSAPVYQSWRFKHDNPATADQALSLTVDWGSASAYDVTWEYQPESNTYLRQQGGEIAKTQAGGTILANNVIAIATDITVVDGVGRRHIRTLGEGDAVIMQDGRLILGRWKKSTRTDRLRFYTVDGSEVSMNAGKTWIEVVPSLDKTDTFTALQP